MLPFFLVLLTHFQSQMEPMDIVGKVKENALLLKCISLGLSFLIFVILDLEKFVYVVSKIIFY